MRVFHNSLLSLESISEGTGTSFNMLAVSSDIPSDELELPFEADFNADANFN